MSTPALSQYLMIKNKYSEYLIFYRMGDFYELFFEDAVKAAPLLGICLTKRGKYEDKDVPMCGVQHSYGEQYMNKLVALGYKVAVCEQTETPEDAKKRGNNSVINREVVKIITPGTVTDSNLLNEKTNNYLLCIIENTDDECALAWADVSTQKFYFDTMQIAMMHGLITLLSPNEILISENTYKNNKIVEAIKSIKSITKHANSLFDAKRSENTLKSFYNVSALDSIENFSKHELIAVGALVEYLKSIHLGKLDEFALPSRYLKKEFMNLDYITINNLEIFKNINGGKNGSLIDVIDFTVTASGSRLFKTYLANPITSLEILNARLDLVDFFYNDIVLCESTRSILSKVYDFERALTRVCLSSNAEPKDILIIKESLKQVDAISNLFTNHHFEKNSSLKSIIQLLGNHEDLVCLLEDAIYEHANKKSDGNYIKDEFDPKLSQCRNLIDNAEKFIINLTVHYRTITGINNLKISSNNILGYYIEVSSSHKLDSSIFIHRQSLSNAVRYTTEELKELEYKIISAKNSYIAIQLEIFSEICTKVKKNIESIRMAASGISKIDVITALSKMAHELRLVRPVLNNGIDLKITKGRHLIVEQSGNFIPNDLQFSDAEKICLLTGPNMAGKSTFLRQNALIIILAQIGSFVPAESALIGLVDRIFTRIGASDNISAGRSTFMIEMIESAAIVNMATEKSFVILDEVGRGTSTYDGVSIAHAVVEHLHNINKCRTIFATHYHELCSLENALKFLRCYTMKVVEWEGKIIFMHEVINGFSGKSYGIHVAKLSGMPKSIVDRAMQLLATYENSNHNHNHKLNINS